MYIYFENIIYVVVYYSQNEKMGSAERPSEKNMNNGLVELSRSSFQTIF